MSFNLNPLSEYPSILICGQSGTGKSASVEFCDPETTAIINSERKVLPFKGWKKFKHYYSIPDPSNVSMKFFELCSNPSIDLIFFDSFESYSCEVYRQARAKSKGWDVINDYNKSIYDFLVMSKTQRGKFIVITALDEIVNLTLPEGGNSSVRRAKVHGKETIVESHFTITFFTDVTKNPDGSMKYSFVTNTDGINSAKSPKGMFTFQKIDNNLKQALESVKSYYE